MAEVSYLLTSYNKAAFLPCVLESIRREQAATGGQIVILDDGSSDGSAQICRDFAAANPGVVLLEQENRGVYAALNRLLPLASGKWIRLCDSDDPLILGSTDYLIEMAELDDAAIAYGGAVPYGPEPLPLQALESIRPVACASFVHPDALMHLIQAMDFTTSRAIYRGKAAKAALPLPEHLISCQDFALALRMTATGPLVRLREPVCFYLGGAPNQLSASEALTRHQTIRILQASRAYLKRRHRNAAIIESYRWGRRALRRERRGLRFQLGKMALKTLSTATRLGIYDWHRALDAFASPYESQLGAIIGRRTKPY
ncbi:MULTISPECIES: glycosyltransferase [Rhodomicrobium]|uniref:glycosyltransferase n=1 Tax=Rhodomicrobium TaxID=1068 RepID=UPI000B4BE311|nr:MULTISPECIES: glycosyltransferase [Rhodomicrobium]